MTTTLTSVRTAVTAAAAAAMLASPALATDGNLYYGGPQPNWATGAQATVTVPQANVWQVSLPELSPALSGTKWAMAWGCPVGGSEIAYVNWSALRYAAPSAFAQEVVSEYGTEYSLPDVYLPQSPNLAANYSLAVPHGRCSATLRLRQGDQVKQHARVYWIGHPHVYYRDLTAPAVGIRSVPTGWINASASRIDVAWGAADNWGSDGMTWQNVGVAGLPKWSGLPGAGEHAVSVDLAGVPDGTKEVTVDVSGDGTASSRAVATIFVDRTPPTAQAPTVTPTGQPGVADYAWTTGDDTSGVTETQLEVNTATDGSVTGSWLPFGTLMRNTGGPVGVTNVSLVNVVADGLHAVRVRARDVAGNIAYSPTSTPVVVDTTPPTVEIGPVPATAVRTLTLDVALDDNLWQHLGLGQTRVLADTAPDGSASGSFIEISGFAQRPRGSHRIPLNLVGLVDGRHLVTVETRNGGPASERLIGRTSVVVTVDQTSPTLSGSVFRRIGEDRFEVAWNANDERSGVARAHVEWFDGSSWVVHAAAAASNGAGTLAFDTTGLPDGQQLFRLVVFDTAGNSAVRNADSAFTLDRVAPGLSDLTVTNGPPWSVSWQTSGADGRSCATRIFLNGPQTALQWVEVATAPGTTGPHMALLPVEGFAPGAYRVRLTACDAIGNTTTVETAGFLITAQPSITKTTGGAASPAASRLASANLTVSVSGIRAKRVGDRSRFTVRVGHGARVRVTGRLTDAAGRPIAGETIEARHPSAGAVGTARTASDGRYVLSVRAAQSGVLRIGVDEGGVLLPELPTAEVRLLVVPRVSFRASSRTAVALGAAIVFSGRVTPSQAALRVRTAKAIVLEWRDPIRRTWRPVVNDKLRPDGTFRIAWRFQARGQRIPVRVRVPYELGWNLEEQTSRPITITIR